MVTAQRRCRRVVAMLCGAVAYDRRNFPGARGAHAAPRSPNIRVLARTCLWISGELGCLLVDFHQGEDLFEPRDHITGLQEVLLPGDVDQQKGRNGVGQYARLTN
jgi:hypothetical protein